MIRITTACTALALAVLAPLTSSAQGARQWEISPAMEGQLAAKRSAIASRAASSPWWIGEPAPLFVSISREIYDASIADEDGAAESWLMYSCSADGPRDILRGFWAARLDLLLFDATGRLIYASENDEADDAGGICAFGSLETWLDDHLISVSFIEFPRELEPAYAVIYVASDERSEVRLLTDASSTVYRPVEEE